MSEYYGIMDNGVAQQRTLRGHKTKGLVSTTATQSNGAIHVSIWYNEEEGEDYCRIYLAPWRGIGKQAEFYWGAISKITDSVSNNGQ